MDNRFNATPNEMYAGYMPLSLEGENDEGAFFFWLVKQSKANMLDGTSPKRLVVWLNGGPGCTSLLGLIMEHGPFTVKDSANGNDGFTFVRNKYSWSEEADIIYVEQPIRTGFSLASQNAQKIRNEKNIAHDFTNFIRSFITIFKEYQGVPLFIAGESYAGFYVPWISKHILQLKHSDKKSDRETIALINLQGIAIGNGAIDYAIQEPSYAEYAYYHGLIPLQTKTRLEEEWNRCMDSLQEDGERFITVGDFEKCDLMGKTLAASGHPNEYNVETFHSYGNLLFGNSTFIRFFNDPEIQKWLHVRSEIEKPVRPLPGLNFLVEEDEGTLSSEQIFVPANWQACNDQIDIDMIGDHPTSAVPAIRYVANHIRVLLYNGEFDLNCNFLGTQHTLERNLWGSQADKEWSNAERSLWFVNGDIAGQHYQLGNLSFLIVEGAGHLMPMDRPSQALDMLHRFLSSQSFGDRMLPSADEYTGVKLPDDDTSLESLSQNNAVTYQGPMALTLVLLSVLATIWIIHYWRNVHFWKVNNHRGGTSSSAPSTTEKFARDRKSVV